MAKSNAKPKKIKKVMVMSACPDCTVVIADGGKGEFKYPKAGLINENTSCLNCNGSGIVEN